LAEGTGVVKSWSGAICALVIGIGAHPALADEPASPAETRSQEVHAAEAAGWSLEETDDDPRTGFRLYSRPSDLSNFRAYRLEARIAASPGEACDAAMLYASSPELAATGQHRSVLERAPDSLLVYTHIDFPMAADREITTRISKRTDDATGSCRLEWEDANDAGPEPVEGRVRIVSSRGFWRFDALPYGNQKGNQKEGDEERTRVVYESYADLGGRIPAWLINSLMGSSIAEQIDGLRLLIAERSEGDGDSPEAL